VTSGHGALKLEEKKERRNKIKVKGASRSRVLADTPALAQTLTAFATSTWPAAPCTEIAGTWVAGARTGSQADGLDAWAADVWIASTWAGSLGHTI
jgi:hypothetical protein